jgi:hypothetical protein
MKCLTQIAAALFVATCLVPPAETTSAAGRRRIDVTADELRAESKKIAPLLPEKPQGFGRSISDRKAWDALAAVPAYAATVAHARALIKTPLPETTDELYLDFSRTGNRTRWQKVASRRRSRIGDLTIAECIENRGRFLPHLEEVIAAICAEKTWVMPAHDPSLRNFKQQTVDIDLGSSYVANTLALADSLLGDKLSAAARKRIREKVAQFIFDPYRDMLAGKRGRNFWMQGTNNWNAVCQANVTGAALALIESRQTRAEYIVAAMRLSENFLNGFTPDGYCSEGLGYWSYGFGHYILLCESIRQATGGKVDPMTAERVRAPALFPLKIVIVGGVSPAFADCSVNTRPPAATMHYLARRYGLGADADDDGILVSPSSFLNHALMYSFPNAATAAPPAKAAYAGPGVRSWFKDAGVLVCRPAPKTPCRIGAALKGGHNAEHHNHNDVGSYVLVVEDKPVLVDPGSEVYTARTFSSKRYVSKVLNSFGHPVPVVAGKLQSPGGKARGEVLRTEFTDETDTFAIDLRSAYAVKELRKLQRTFVYSRKGDGSLTVTDEVEFTTPQTFETAFVTLGDWKQTSPASLLIYDRKQAVRVELDTGGKAFTVIAEQLKEDVRCRSLPTRVGIRLATPVTAAKITARIVPGAIPSRKESRP